jgi:hypothetical protein
MVLPVHFFNYHKWNLRGKHKFQFTFGHEMVKPFSIHTGHADTHQVMLDALVHLVARVFVGLVKIATRPRYHHSDNSIVVEGNRAIDLESEFTKYVFDPIVELGYVQAKPFVDCSPLH